jgi:ribulose 1,5-bisphosphate synthetase/thiazole synthase
MKTLKLVMIAALLTTALVSNATTDGTKIRSAKKVVDMTFDQAMKVPGLVIAMYEQLNNGFLLNIQPIYTVTVDYQKYVVRITGTQEQWVWFFKTKWVDTDPVKVGKIDLN